MIPTGLVIRLLFVVGTLLAISLVTIVGIPRLKRVRRQFRCRWQAAYPYVGLLAVVLVINSFARDVGEQLSWLLDWNITGLIYAIEGEFVATVQSFATPAVTSFLSFIYIYGYIFLLVFPILAYIALDDLEPFRHTMLAYTFNYAIGIVCYTLFIAYGPRNLMPDLVDSLLYANWPQSKFLTSQVNTNTNVFPSLHTSLAVTVVLLAYRTRRIYPSWLVLSVPLAASVVVSTMYLGIHWGTDVVAGIGLAGLSIGLSERLTDDQGKQQWLERIVRRFVVVVKTRVRKGREWLVER